MILYVSTKILLYSLKYYSCFILYIIGSNAILMAVFDSAPPRFSARFPIDNTPINFFIFSICCGPIIFLQKFDFMRCLKFTAYMHTQRILTFIGIYKKIYDALFCLTIKFQRVLG